MIDSSIIYFGENDTDSTDNISDTDNSTYTSNDNTEDGSGVEELK